MTNFSIIKPYLLNIYSDFDEELLISMSKEASIKLVPPIGPLSLSIKLCQEKDPCVSNIGYPGQFVRYILKDYITEDFEYLLIKIFNKIKKYGRFINLGFYAFSKQSMNITLKENYKSLKDIMSLELGYDISSKYDNDSHSRSIKTELVFVFDGHSSYNLKLIGNEDGVLNIVLSYTDIDGFWLRFLEAYKKDFTDKLGIDEDTDIQYVQTLIDMSLT